MWIDSIYTVQVAARETNECEWPLGSGSALITYGTLGYQHCPIKQL